MSLSSEILDVDRLMRLWTVPPTQRADVESDFAQVYADPVHINGQPVSLAALVDRARAVHTAFSQHHITVVELVENGDKVAVAFRHRAVHDGSWCTSAGVVPATGLEVHGVGIDVLTVRDGRIEQIWVVADELQRLQQVASPRLELGS
jgi:predicted ester cyclase